MGFLKEKWTEAEVLALPDGEQDFFDRKSGLAFEKKPEFKEIVAKALSALANSGGGHLVLGQDDDGRFSGLPPFVGRTPMQEWLEQTLPNLLSYPLESFRVHQVYPAADSSIPEGKVVIVVDVGDSRLAPHQAIVPANSPTYYFRQGGRSVAAPHHYLEALRNRMVGVALDVKVITLKSGTATADYRNSQHTIFNFWLDLKLVNSSRIACLHWHLDCWLESDSQTGEPGTSLRLKAGNDTPTDLLIVTSQYSGTGHPILPTREVPLTIGLRYIQLDRQDVAARFASCLQRTRLVCTVITESFIGPRIAIVLSAIAGGDRIGEEMIAKLPRPLPRYTIDTTQPDGQ